jgi:hypothetical protein
VSHALCEERWERQDLERLVRERTNLAWLVGMFHGGLVEQSRRLLLELHRHVSRPELCGLRTQTACTRPPALCNKHHLCQCWVLQHEPVSQYPPVLVLPWPLRRLTIIFDRKNKVDAALSTLTMIHYVGHFAIKRTLADPILV